MGIYFIADFDPHAIAASGQCFRMRAVSPNRVEAVMRDQYTAITSLGSDLYEFSCSDADYQHIWRPYFDLDTDYGAFHRAVDENDPYLLHAAELSRGLRILRQDPWEVLISFILSQRKSIPAIQDAIEKLCGCFGSTVTSQGRSFNSFPSPQALADVPEEALRACSVGYRAPYIKAAAQAAEKGELDLAGFSRLTDEELTKQLLAIYGVGIKVANCVSLFGYHRLAAAPVDVWIQRVIDDQYGGISPFGRYPGFAGIMQQFMFYERMMNKQSPTRPKKAKTA